MLTVVLVVLAVAGVWALVAVSFAFLAGGVIHARDHRDAPYGGFSARARRPARHPPPPAESCRSARGPELRARRR